MNSMNFPQLLVCIIWQHSLRVSTSDVRIPLESWNAASNGYRWVKLRNHFFCLEIRIVSFLTFSL